jgi:hypothetical protein
MELVAQGHVYDDVSNTCQPKVLDHEVSLLQSATVWHAVSFVSARTNKRHHHHPLVNSLGE